MDDLNRTLSDVCFVRFGSELSIDNKSTLLVDLVHYQRYLRRLGQETISEQAIRAWLPKKGGVHGPKRSSAMAFLGGYLDWINSKHLIKEEAQQARYRTLAITLRLHQPSIKAQGSEGIDTGIDKALRNIKLNSPDPYMTLALQLLASVSSSNRHHDYIDLPARTKIGTEADEAYYLLFRYDSSGCHIIKSFLALKAPLPGIESFASFNHFAWPGRTSEETPRKHSHRECEGILLKLASSYYLLGYNYDVRENKKMFPREFNSKRLSAKLHPLGLETMSLQYDNVGSRSGLYDGVSMTVTNSNKAVVSRVAFLYLGTKGSLGFKLNDSIIEPCELRVRQGEQPGYVIAGDLQASLERVRALGPKHLPDRYQPSGPAVDGEGSWEFSTGSDIARLIDNGATSDEAGGSEPVRRGKRKSGRPIRGAIEALD